VARGSVPRQSALRQYVCRGGQSSQLFGRRFNLNRHHLQMYIQKFLWIPCCLMRVEYLIHVGRFKRHTSGGIYSSYTTLKSASQRFFAKNETKASNFSFRTSQIFKRSRRVLFSSLRLCYNNQAPDGTSNVLACFTIILYLCTCHMHA